MKHYAYMLLAWLLVSPVFAQTIDRLVDEWDRQDNQAAQQCLSSIDDYFVSQKQAIPAFTDELYTLYAKAAILFDSQYAPELWAKHLFTESQVSQVFEKSLRELEYDLAASQNRLLIQIDIELQHLGKPKVALQLPDFRDILRQQLAKTSNHAGKQAVTSEIISLIVGDIVIGLVSKVAHQAATEGAVGGVAKAAGGLASFGLSVVILLCVDYAVTAISKGQTERLIVQQIDAMRDQVTLKLRPAIFQALSDCQKQRRELICALR